MRAAYLLTLLAIAWGLVLMAHRAPRYLPVPAAEAGALNAQAQGLCKRRAGAVRLPDGWLHCPTTTVRHAGAKGLQ